MRRLIIQHCTVTVQISKIGKIYFIMQHDRHIFCFFLIILYINCITVQHLISPLLEADCDHFPGTSVFYVQYSLSQSVGVNYSRHYGSSIDLVSSVHRGLYAFVFR
jgi:hypothetical protein